VPAEANVKRSEEEREPVLARFREEHGAKGKVLRDVAETHVDVRTHVADADIAIDCQRSEIWRDGEGPSASLRLLRQRRTTKKERGKHGQADNAGRGPSMLMQRHSMPLF
jgi:hypothetical protein